MSNSLQLFTIGHSTHTLEAFLSLLKDQHITHIIDVRAHPGSRRMPWFNEAALKKSLAKEKIEYTHMPDLGGMRKPRADSINQGWRKESFRGYADYMQTSSFQKAIATLNSMLPTQKVALMCAEAHPLHCHRSLISDAEWVRGVEVIHLLSDHSLQPHALTRFAVVNHSTKPISLTYPKPQQSLDV